MSEQLRPVLLGLTILGAAGAALAWRVRGWPVYAALRRARPAEAVWDQPGRRLGSLVLQAVAHLRLLREPWAGAAHLLLFLGFVAVVPETVRQALVLASPRLAVLPAWGGLADVGVLSGTAGALLGIAHRALWRPARLSGSNAADAYGIMGFIILILAGVALQQSFAPHPNPAAFLGRALGRLWVAWGWSRPGTAQAGYALGYLLDVGASLAFLAYLPSSKHLHIFAAWPNVFFRRLGSAGRLAPRDPPAAGPAVHSVADLTWKDLLDLLSCAACGRCQAACPAYAAGLPLSPAALMRTLRGELLRPSPPPGGAGADLAGTAVSAPALWSCSACGACREACPVFVEHLPKVVGLRAALLEEGRLDPGLAKALVSLDRQGNSRGRSATQRSQWTSGLDFPVPDARNKAVEVLWFVGDWASYDPRVIPSTRRLAQLLHRSDIRFGLLHDAEVDPGNEALRVGEHGLFASLADRNLTALGQARYRRVCTTDPHCLNALRNEYRSLGFTTPVLHHSQLLLELVRTGVLRLSPLGLRATYHDPCYLGRWNDVFAPPRQLLARMGVDLVEMPHHGRASRCCGAGGGRIWLADPPPGGDPAKLRLQEALSLPGVTHLVVACPQDLIMFQAAAAGTPLQVVELADLVYRAAGLDPAD
ncbi:MAG: (Fe-S)-binding protein [Thermaerobacter sp.]|nr:(Fe-S)-binding protein [Thermaerobacter sp.]